MTPACSFLLAHLIYCLSGEKQHSGQSQAPCSAPSFFLLSSWHSSPGQDDPLLATTGSSAARPLLQEQELLCSITESAAQCCDFIRKGYIYILLLLLLNYLVCLEKNRWALGQPSPSPGQNYIPQTPSFFFFPPRPVEITSSDVSLWHSQGAQSSRRRGTGYPAAPRSRRGC